MHSTHSVQLLISELRLSSSTIADSLLFSPERYTLALTKPAMLVLDSHRRSNDVECAKPSECSVLPCLRGLTNFGSLEVIQH